MHKLGAFLHHFKLTNNKNNHVTIIYNIKRRITMCTSKGGNQRTSPNKSKKKVTLRIAKAAAKVCLNTYLLPGI